MMKNIAQIAIIKPLHNLFDYEIPENIVSLEPGSRVLVEFGKKQVFGFVIKTIKQKNSLNYKLKKIIAIVDKEPLIDKETLNLFIWVSNYYHAPLGQVIGLGTPSLLRQGKKLPDEKINILETKEHSELKNFKLSADQNDAIKIIKKSEDESY